MAGGWGGMCVYVGGGVSLEQQGGGVMINKALFFRSIGKTMQAAGS